LYTLNIHCVVVPFAQRYALIKSSIAIGFCSGPPSRMEASPRSEGPKKITLNAFQIVAQLR
jgi:hypothetical protein